MCGIVGIFEYRSGAAVEHGRRPTMSSRSSDPVPSKPAAQRTCNLCGRVQPAARLVHAAFGLGKRES